MLAGNAASPDRVIAGATAESTDPMGARHSLAAAEAPRQFQLSSLFLTITVICLCLGLFRAAPGLVIPLMVIAVPALVRTRRASRLASMAGKPLSLGARIGTFITSIFILALVIVAGFVAFCMACISLFLPTIGAQGAGQRNETSVVQLLLIGGSVALIFFVIWISRAIWPKAK
jgi:hypothetical protein